MSLEPFELIFLMKRIYHKKTKYIQLFYFYAAKLFVEYIFLFNEKGKSLYCRHRI